MVHKDFFIGSAAATPNMKGLNVEMPEHPTYQGPQPGDRVGTSFDGGRRHTVRYLHIKKGAIFTALEPELTDNERDSLLKPLVQHVASRLTEMSSSNRSLHDALHWHAIRELACDYAMKSPLFGELLEIYLQQVRAGKSDTA